MKDSESIKDFADRLMKIMSKIRILGEELEDQRVVEKVLISLPLRFEHKICSLEDNKDVTKMSVSELVNSLHIAELRHNMRSGEGSEAALVS